MDLRCSLRLLVRNRVFTLATVTSIGLGIGAAAATFNLVRPLLDSVPAVADQARLAFVWSLTPGRETDRSAVSLADFADWRAGAETFDELAAWVPTAYNLASSVEPVRVTAGRVSTNFFDTLDVAPVAGRMFGERDGGPGVALAVVLSHGLWRRAFAADPALVGREVTLDGRPALVVGVAPEGLDALGPELWTPLGPVTGGRDRGERNAYVLGRLAPGATTQQASANLSVIAARLEREHPATNTGWATRVVLFAEQIGGPELSLVIALLATSVGLVLVIGCANVANLLVAQSEERRREFALRAALGAARRRLVMQTVTESIVLGVAGGAAGLLLAWAGTRTLASVFSDMVAIADRIVVDRQTVALALALSFATAVLFGLWPAWRSRRADLRSILASSGRAGGSTRSSVRSALVAAEVALAAVLLIVTGLLVRTVIGLEAVPPGFDPERVITMRVTLPEVPYGQPNRIVGFVETALERIRALPGVTGVGATSRLPGAGRGRNPIRSVSIEGRPTASDADAPWGVNLAITPGYLEALGVPLVSGRHLAPHDRIDAERVAVVSETFAGRYFGDRTAIGRRIALGDTAAGEPWLTVVGVVSDIRNDNADQPPLPQIYLPFAQQPQRTVSLIARTAADPLASAGAVGSAVQDLDPALAVYAVQTITQMLANDTAESRAIAGILGAFGAMALLLAAVGIYGVVAYVAALRRHEIGIRRALGATGRDIFQSIVVRGMRPVIVGLAVGLAAASALSRLLASMLFGVRPLDPATFGTVTIVLVAVALIACSVPAIRSMRVDPATSLRYE